MVRNLALLVRMHLRSSNYASNDFTQTLGAFSWYLLRITATKTVCVISNNSTFTNVLKIIGHYGLFWWVFGFALKNFHTLVFAVWSPYTEEAAYTDATDVFFEVSAVLRTTRKPARNFFRGIYFDTSSAIFVSHDSLRLECFIITAVLFIIWKAFLAVRDICIDARLFFNHHTRPFLMLLSV